MMFKSFGFFTSFRNRIERSKFFKQAVFEDGDCRGQLRPICEGVGIWAFRLLHTSVFKAIEFDFSFVYLRNESFF